MKELSIEEKARAYDEAIKYAHYLINERCKEDTDGSFHRADLNRMFPKLVENEDERIRKALIDYFRWNPNSQLLNEFSNREVFAWLEKQVEKGTNGNEREIPNSEQKPTDKVEPKFHEGDIIIHKELGGDYIHNSHKIIQVDILDKKYRLEGGLVAHFSEQDDYELVEQKPAWSEEDEKMMQYVIGSIDTNISDSNFKNIRSWFEALKERVQPQPKQEWSEEDEEEFQIAIDTLAEAGQNDSAHWLKSLKERYTWKPSLAQMNALSIVSKGNAPDDMEAIVSLYNDLKKLKEK